MYSAPPAAIRVAFSAGALRDPWNVERARSSAGEHYVDIVGVTSSILVAPTIPFSPQISLDFAGPFSSSEDDTSAESAIGFFPLSSHFRSMKMTLSSLVLRLRVRLVAKARGLAESGTLPRLCVSRGACDAAGAGEIRSLAGRVVVYSVFKSQGSRCCRKRVEHNRNIELGQARQSRPSRDLLDSQRSTR